MESRELNNSPGESYVGNGPVESATQRIRKSLQDIFENPVLLRADGPLSQHAELRASLRQVSADARHAGIRAEQLLVLIKNVWSGLAPGVAQMRTVHGDERLNYVVSTCVDEYYGHRPAGHEGAP